MTAPIIQTGKQAWGSCHTRKWFCRAVAITYTHSRDQRGQKTAFRLPYSFNTSLDADAGTEVPPHAPDSIGLAPQAQARTPNLSNT